ncbi:hypothetical protein E2C01_028724 [Portunus trituberculatus]|uniref:Transmembrane protein n=1 Tax=Portunus trituberculatus TaxID=210409 RepID=A0A5B7EM98_PORTR|nr:hypothetical protein [Portunus trituberculatus]
MQATLLCLTERVGHSPAQGEEVEVEDCSRSSLSGSVTSYPPTHQLTRPLTKSMQRATSFLSLDFGFSTHDGCKERVALDKRHKRCKDATRLLVVVAVAAAVVVVVVMAKELPSSILVFFSSYSAAFSMPSYLSIFGSCRQADRTQN